MWIRTAVWTALALAACGGGGGAGADADSDSDSNSDGDSDTDGDTDTDVPYCVQTCDDASDCVGSTSTAVTDEDNYECTAEGYCRNTGCNSTEECQTAISSDLWGCPEDPGPYEVPSCVHVCDTAEDCSLGAALYDADNYVCTAEGLCEYTGCNDTAECEETTPGTVCADVAGLDIDLCQTSCGEPAECAADSPPDAEDEDNYDCVDDLCVYTGCNSEEECQNSWNSSYTCAGL